jgi:hypothetical protein
LSQDAAKPEEDKHGERQEDDGVDVEHVSISLGVAITDDTPDGGSRSRTPRYLGHSSRGYSLCRHAPGTIQWPRATQACLAPKLKRSPAARQHLLPGRTARSRSNGRLPAVTIGALFGTRARFAENGGGSWP